MINDIFDHKMIFTYIENTTYNEEIDKYIKIERKNHTAMLNFVKELKSMKICENLNQNVNIPQVNNCAKEKHLQPKIVKYNKKKHKK